MRWSFRAPRYWAPRWSKSCIGARSATHRIAAATPSAVAGAVLVWLTALVLAFAPMPGAAHATTYDVIELRGGLGSIAAAVNADRMVLGHVCEPDVGWVPAVFSPEGEPTVIAPVRGSVGTISAAGFVPIEANGEAYVWKAGVTTLLPRLPSGRALRGPFITGDGIIYGTDVLFEFNEAGETIAATFRAYRFADGAYTDLGTFDAPNVVFGTANTRGTVVIIRCDALGYSIDTLRVDRRGRRTDLAAAAGPDVTGYVVATNGINERGDVAGSAYYAGGQRAAVLLIGRHSHVMTLPGQTVIATAINNRRDAVGTSFDDASGFQSAVIWREGRTTSLALLPEALAAGWTHLRSAYDINDDGVIVGYGIKDGQERGFMLVPRRR
jgi:hypothetical protein